MTNTQYPDVLDGPMDFVVFSINHEAIDDEKCSQKSQS